MKFWQMVTWSETEQYVDIARSAEACGFHGVMNADHAFYPQHLTSPYPYSEDGKPPMGGESEYPDPWVSIAQMAAVTSTLCFSTSVYILPLRNPIEVAKATASLALMSGNRFMLGAGIGWINPWRTNRPKERHPNLPPRMKRREPELEPGQASGMIHPSPSGLRLRRP